MCALLGSYYLSLIKKLSWHKQLLIHIILSHIVVGCELNL
jgi:hypothetical protein